VNQNSTVGIPPVAICS